MSSPVPTRPALATTATALLLLAFASFASRSSSGEPDAPESKPGPDRSPVALVLSLDGTRLLTANQTAGTVSLVDTVSGKVLAEVPTGDKPAGVALSKDGTRAAVTHWYGYDLAVLDVGTDSMKVAGRVEVGPEPRGVAIGADGASAYVAVGVSNEVVRVDLDRKIVTGRLTVGREPRGVALTPDGSRLLVSNARSSTLSMIALGPWQVERTIPIQAKSANLRQVAISPDGATGYVASMRNPGFATTSGNIDQGWVLGQCLTRVSLDDPSTFATLTLDTRRRAAADAHGVAVSPDGTFLAVSCGGTHEVMIFRTDKRPLPFREDGSRDLIPAELLRNDGRYRRVATGGRPTELAFAPDGRTLFAANYFANAVQVIDAATGELTRTIALGGPEEVSIVRRGEMLFHDAGRSFNQWYSCNSCHSDGHTNGIDFDTLNDGRQDLSSAHRRSRKKAPTMRRVTLTAPWTWHGWQTRLDDAMVESFTKSMQGKRPSADDVKSLVAFLGTLEYPRNPYREKDGSLSPAAKSGEAVFKSAKAACNTCHGGPELTDGKVHIAGLEERDDAYRGYNPPSLKGVYDKDPYMHDGRAKTLREALTGPHSPDSVTGLGELSERELDDLVEYLKSL
jgi:YVTN family beta-propeller protein